MGTPKRLERCLRLAELFRNGMTGTIDQLAAHFGVGRRTIFRDLLVLDKIGIRTEMREERESLNVMPTAVTQDTSRLPLLMYLIGVCMTSRKSDCKQLYRGLSPRFRPPTHAQFADLLSKTGSQFSKLYLTKQQAQALSNIAWAMSICASVSVEFLGSTNGRPNEAAIQPLRMLATDQGWLIDGRMNDVEIAFLHHEVKGAQLIPKLPPKKRSPHWATIRKRTTV